jgi:tetratricopeptide (TPR) repeat protein
MDRQYWRVQPMRIDPMSYRARSAIRCLAILCVACIAALVASVSRAHATSIVLGDIEYTREGRIDDEGRSAIEAYLEFFLSRLEYPRPQRIADYVRECRSGLRPKEPDGSCSYPDFYIQLQIAERQGEAQISGAVGRKIEPRNFRTHNLDSLRVKMGELTEGLSRVAKRITTIVGAGAVPIEQIHVVVTCFGSGFEQPNASPLHRRSSAGRAPAATSIVAAYAHWLPKVLVSLMRDPPRMMVSTNANAGTECGSLEGLEAIAQTVQADAVLSGRIFTDDKSGLMVLPYLFVTGANKKIALQAIPVPRAADKAAVAQIGQQSSVAAKAAESPKLKDIDPASYLLVASKLGALATALVGSPKRVEFVKAVNNGSEVSFYLERAKEHLSSSPPNYGAADALLELAKSKAPGDPQPYLLLATSLTDRTRYMEAAATLHLGISEVADRKALYVALAENFVRAGELLEARKVYEEALSKSILAEEALLGIARTYLAARPPERSPEKATTYAMEAAKQNPSSPDGYALAGQIAESEDNFELAEQYYQDALRISPGSSEITVRLSSLYERLATKALNERSPEAAIRYLTRSIDVSPSVRKYYDRAQAYCDPDRKSDDRAKDYASASADYQAALQIAQREKNVLAQFPWLMPNLVESLIFEGKFSRAKIVARDLFAILASDSTIRPSSNPKEIRLVAAFLNATAEILDSGSADKEIYLLENATLGMERTRLPWSFADMLSFLDNDYPRIKAEITPGEQETRVAAVKRWIDRLGEWSP